MWPTSHVRIGDRLVGDGQPVFVIAEIGINHNGSLDMAKKLIDGALFAGCDAVKFQKRTPELCVPRDQWEILLSLRGSAWWPWTTNSRWFVRRRSSTTASLAGRPPLSC
jgi:sialic acid synthase SpsE